jgi:serine/threonine protein phosphatase PrpC
MAIARALPSPRPRMLQITAAGRTTVGRRDHNEDAYLVRPDLGMIVLADGMGGYAGGALASQLTVDAVARSFEDDAAEPAPTSAELAAHAHAAVLLAHRNVRAVRTGPHAQMGSTVVVLAFRGKEAAVAHAGDSRLYLLRAGVLSAVTADHSFLRELAHRAGDERELEHMRAQWGHVVTRAIGHGETLAPDVAQLSLMSGDVLLLCSDGLHGVLEDAEIADALTMFSPDDACEVLLARAIEAGSRDNVTACIARVS